MTPGATSGDEAAGTGRVWIYPTRRAVLAAAAIAPLALVLALLRPDWWSAGLLLLVALLLACAADALFGLSPARAALRVETPGAVGVGESFALVARARIAGSRPSRLEAALGLEGPAEPVAGARATVGGDGAAPLAYLALRRGTARLATAWLRWTGPLGLVWKQREYAPARPVVISPDIRAVREKSAQLNRDPIHGITPQLQVGEGAEFDALTDYRQGMDRRAIDWKQSARHTRLIAKEYRTERNNQIVVAIDSGRVMCEPLQGVPRVDRAVSAALLAAFVALKDGDRVGLFAFDSRPRASSRPISGPRAFTLLQRAAAGIGYGTAETNYTLGLTTLANGLNRRSLIIVFTEFSDTISAELMLKAVGTMLKRHLVLFVVMRDEELEAFTAAEAHEPADVSRAVVAAGLLRERALVLAKLRHLGVHVIEATAANAGPALVASYVELKRKDLL